MSGEDGAEARLQAVLRERAVLLAARRTAAPDAPPAFAAASGRLLLVSAGAERFALPLAAVGGVLPVAAYPHTPVPGAGRGLLGLIGVRGGAPLPLFDAAELLGAPASGNAPVDGGHVVLLREPGARAGAGAGAGAAVGLRFDRAEGVAEASAYAAAGGGGAGAAVVLTPRPPAEGAAVTLIDPERLLAGLRAGPPRPAEARPPITGEEPIV